VFVGDNYGNLTGLSYNSLTGSLNMIPGYPLPANSGYGGTNPIWSLQSNQYQAEIYCSQFGNQTPTLYNTTSFVSLAVAPGGVVSTSASPIISQHNVTTGEIDLTGDVAITNRGLAAYMPYNATILNTTYINGDGVVVPTFPANDNTQNFSATMPALQFGFPEAMAGSANAPFLFMLETNPADFTLHLLSYSTVGWPALPTLSSDLSTAATGYFNLSRIWADPQGQAVAAIRQDVLPGGPTPNIIIWPVDATGHLGATPATTWTYLGAPVKVIWSGDMVFVLEYTGFDIYFYNRGANTLTHAFTQSTGAGSVDAGIDPTNSFVFIANSNGNAGASRNTVSVFAINNANTKNPALLSVSQVSGSPFVVDMLSAIGNVDLTAITVLH
jgi:hypothetical protein